MKKIIVFLFIAELLTGCSSKILLPYEENPICSAGKEGGYCGSLTDVYKKIEEEEEGK